MVDFGVAILISAFESMEFRQAMGLEELVDGLQIGGMLGQM